MLNFLFVPLASGKQLNFASSVAGALTDPYDAEAFWWLGNCPAADCFDGDVSTTSADTCGANTTNLCHTAYVDQIHTLTYTFTGSYYVEEVTIWNKVHAYVYAHVHVHVYAHVHALVCCTCTRIQPAMELCCACTAWLPGAATQLHSECGGQSGQPASMHSMW